MRLFAKTTAAALLCGPILNPNNILQPADALDVELYDLSSTSWKKIGEAHAAGFPLFTPSSPSMHHDGFLLHSVYSFVSPPPGVKLPVMLQRQKLSTAEWNKRKALTLAARRRRLLDDVEGEADNNRRKLLSPSLSNTREVVQTLSKLNAISKMPFNYTAEYLQGSLGEIFDAALNVKPCSKNSIK